MTYYTRVPGFSGIGRTREGTRLQGHLWSFPGPQGKYSSLLVLERLERLYVHNLLGWVLCT